MEIELGDGNVLIGALIDTETHEPGLIFLKADTQQAINTPAPGFTAGSRYRPAPDDVVIWIKNLASARVLQDQVNRIVLELNGNEVTSKKEHPCTLT